VILDKNKGDFPDLSTIDYKFDQATDREGQIAGIPRGGLPSVSLLDAKRQVNE
jgi:hypothetical protein